MTLPGLFRETVRNFGQGPALAIVGQTPVTYIELENKVHEVVSFMESKGIQPGDKVAILSMSSPDWVVWYYAITFMGAIAVPILPDFHEDEIQNILIHSEARAIYFSDNLKPKLPPSLDKDLPGLLYFDERAREQ